jgi:hypothetical protein
VSAHTPGPWRVGPINYADVYGPDGEIVALVPKGFDATVANAHLIAAAPELLEALEMGRRALATAVEVSTASLYDSRAECLRAVAKHLVITQMDAAIAKAKGTTTGNDHAKATVPEDSESPTT